MFNDKPKEGGGIRKPAVEIAGGTIGPDVVRLPSGRVPVLRYTRKFSAGGKAGYRKVADGCAKRGKTRGKMV